MFGSLLKTILSAAALILMTSPVFADSIDGSWCHKDGRHFSIRGPEIVTPGGIRMEGSYSRHGFSYKTPALEAGAGQTIVMTLANENTVYVHYGEAASITPQETWVRCLPSISLFESTHHSQAAARYSSEAVILINPPFDTFKALAAA